MIKAGIIGTTGYTGAELVRILSGHPDVKIISYGSKSYAGMPYASVYSNMYKLTDAVCADESIEELARKADVIFTATPQGYLASRLTEEVLSNAKVIDLSADYRIKDVAVYEQWYGIKHESPQFIEEAVYGLCEIRRKQIKNARLIANPGCYTTCSILAVYPLIKEGVIDPGTIIIDAKSGVSGAGRGAKVSGLFCEVNENTKAYALTTHRHTPEIEQELSAGAGYGVTVNFTPHLVPANRGILSTVYASLIRAEGEIIPSEQTIREIYESYYGGEHFIRILDPGVFPETRWVEGSNFVDINFAVDKRTGRIIVVAALDNLIKGAAGQAVENMNLLFELREDAGISAAPLFP